MSHDFVGKRATCRCLAGAESYFALGHHGPGAPGPVRFNLTIILAPALRPTPTLLTATPIAFAKGSRHDIDRAAFDAGTTLRNAGGGA